MRGVLHPHGMARGTSHHAIVNTFPTRALQNGIVVVEYCLWGCHAFIVEIQVHPCRCVELRLSYWSLVSANPLLAQNFWSLAHNDSCWPIQSAPKERRPTSIVMKDERSNGICLTNLHGNMSWVWCFKVGSYNNHPGEILCLQLGNKLASPVVFRQEVLYLHEYHLESRFDSLTFRILRGAQTHS